MSSRTARRPPRRDVDGGIPFVLANPHQTRAFEESFPRETAAARAAARMAEIADALSPLEAACWRGVLRGRELRRLQDLRVEYRRLQARRERLLSAPRGPSRRRGRGGAREP